MSNLNLIGNLKTVDHSALKVNQIIIISLGDHDQSVHAVQDGITLDADAKLAGIHRAEVGEKHRPHLRILGGAGFIVVLVAYKIQGHLKLL